MSILITALAAAAQAAQPAPAHPPAHNMPAAQMDHSKMDQGKTGEKGGCCCCDKTAGGKMECRMMQGHGKPGGAGQPQGHSGH